MTQTRPALPTTAQECQDCPAMAVGGHDVACIPLTCAQAQTGRRPGAPATRTASAAGTSSAPPATDLPVEAGLTCPHSLIQHQARHPAGPGGLGLSRAESV